MKVENTKSLRKLIAARVDELQVNIYHRRIEFEILFLIRFYLRRREKFVISRSSYDFQLGTIINYCRIETSERKLAASYYLGVYRARIIIAIFSYYRVVRSFCR